LIVGGVIVGVVALVLIVSSLGGSSGGAPKSSGSSATTGTQTHAASPTPSPGRVSVVVFNGTSTNGLAHRLSGDLHQNGYTRAAALQARPPGEYPNTLVEYSSGHHGEAEQVAHALGIGQVQPMSSAVASLAGPSTVAVIAGVDKAGQTSNGEASSGASGAGGASGAAPSGTEAPAGSSGEAPAGGSSSGAGESSSSSGAG